MSDTKTTSDTTTKAVPSTSSLLQTKPVTLIDYGVGNLLSVRRALEVAGAQVVQTGDPEEVQKADHLVLPGVGAFGHCIDELRRQSLDEVVKNHARSGRPLLGICVGMQMLLSYSEEFGEHSGLDVIPGAVKKISVDKTSEQESLFIHKIPHIGWSSLSPSSLSVWENGLLDNTAPGTDFYFVHSFAAHTDDPKHNLAITNCYNLDICAAIQNGNTYGLQFHPERSGPAGIRLLQSFLRLS